MYSHGVIPRGPLYVERLTELPKFIRDKDPGRIVLVKEGNGYFATSTDWVPLGIVGKCVWLDNINFGFSNNEVKASDIPGYLPEIFSSNKTESNIQLIFNEIYHTFENIKTLDYIDDGSINAVKINFEPTTGGMSSKDIKFYDAALAFKTPQYTYTIDEVITDLAKRDGTTIPLGLGITVNSYNVGNDVSIRDAIEELAKQKLNLIAEDIECSYYEYDPTGKSHCVTSNVQVALDDLSHHLANHKIIDHLDVQHNWGRCGQYLGTYGGESDDDTNTRNKWLDDGVGGGEGCCAGPHLPLKFKVIHAKEIDVTVHRPECLCSKDIPIYETMKLQPVITAIIKRLCTLHPVGSVYISFDPTHPAELFGCGEWEYLGSRFLLGCDSPDEPAGGIGGEREHVLTIPEMPFHNHTGIADYGGRHAHSFGCGGGSGNGIHSGFSNDETTTVTPGGEHSHSLSIDGNGGSQPHNNMPPYLKVHMWKRVA